MLGLGGRSKDLARGAALEVNQAFVPASLYGIPKGALNLWQMAVSGHLLPPIFYPRHHRHHHG